MKRVFEDVGNENDRLVFRSNEVNENRFILVKFFLERSYINLLGRDYIFFVLLKVFDLVLNLSEIIIKL